MMLAFARLGAAPEPYLGVGGYILRGWIRVIKVNLGMRARSVGG